MRHKLFFLLFGLALVGCKQPESNSNNVTSSQPESNSRAVTLLKFGEDFFDLAKNPNIRARVKYQPPIYRYPVEAKVAKIQGTVVLHALVDRNGEVRQVQIIQGPRELSDTAVSYAYKWLFEPLVVEGKPRSFVYKFTMPFNLR